MTFLTLFVSHFKSNTFKVKFTAVYFTIVSNAKSQFGSICQRIRFDYFKNCKQQLSIFRVCHFQKLKLENARKQENGENVGFIVLSKGIYSLIYVQA